MSKIVTSTEYQVSDRVVLREGDRFKANGGPYWKSPDGTKHPLAAKGPFTFLLHCKKRGTEWIEACDKEGNHCVLHIAGRRRRIDGCLVPRPYTVTGKKRPVANRRKSS